MTVTDFWTELNVGDLAVFPGTFGKVFHFPFDSHFSAPIQRTMARSAAMTKRKSGKKQSKKRRKNDATFSSAS
jgi:hypothetical protein